MPAGGQGRLWQLGGHTRPSLPRGRGADSLPLLQEPAALRAPFLLLLADIRSNLEQQLLGAEAASVSAWNRQTRRRGGIGTRE